MSCCLHIDIGGHSEYLFLLGKEVKVMVYIGPDRKHYTAEGNKLCVTQVERNGDFARGAEKKRSWASRILTLLLDITGMSSATAVQSVKDTSTPQMSSRCGQFKRRENGSNRASCRHELVGSGVRGRVSDLLSLVEVERRKKEE